MRVLRWLRRSWPAILAVLALAVAATLVWAWRTPSGYFILWPDKAHPAATYLHIPGGKGPAAGTGFYFVDVHELEANSACTRTSRPWTRHRSWPRRWPSEP